MVGLALHKIDFQGKRTFHPETWGTNVGLAARLAMSDIRGHGVLEGVVYLGSFIRQRRSLLPEELSQGSLRIRRLYNSNRHS